MGNEYFIKIFKQGMYHLRILWALSSLGDRQSKVVQGNRLADRTVHGRENIGVDFSKYDAYSFILKIRINVKFILNFCIYFSFLF